MAKKDHRKCEIAGKVTSVRAESIDRKHGLETALVALPYERHAAAEKFLSADRHAIRDDQR